MSGDWSTTGYATVTVTTSGTGLTPCSWCGRGCDCARWGGRNDVVTVSYGRNYFEPTIDAIDDAGFFFHQPWAPEASGPSIQAGPGTFRRHAWPPVRAPPGGHSTREIVNFHSGQRPT